VTAHNKRARIHIWQKVWKKISGRNFVNFIGDGRPGKVFLHPTFPQSGKGFSLMAITESYQENIYRLFFRVHFENDLYYYFCVLCSVVLKTSIGG